MVQTHGTFWAGSGVDLGSRNVILYELQVSNPGSFLRLSLESRAGNTHSSAKNSSRPSPPAFVRDVQEKKKTCLSLQNNKGPHCIHCSESFRRLVRARAGCLCLLKATGECRISQPHTKSKAKWRGTLFLGREINGRELGSREREDERRNHFRQGLLRDAHPA